MYVCLNAGFEAQNAITKYVEMCNVIYIINKMNAKKKYVF